MNKRVPQAERLKEKATANIGLKITILESWILNGIPYLVDLHGHQLLDEKENKILDFYPTSLRSFKEWDGTQNCELVRKGLPKISLIGSDTLSKRPDQIQTVLQLLPALKVRAAEQLIEGRHSELKRLKLEIKALNSLLSIRQSEFRKQRLQLLQLQRDNKNMAELHNREIAQFTRNFKEKDEELLRLKSENSQLISQINKVRPLRAAGSDDQQQS